jgi:hypothetical protein
LIYDQSHELRSVFSNTMRAENSRRVALRALAFKRMPENPPRNAATGQASMGPIRLTDAQLTAVFEAAGPLSVASRDAFLLDLATALQGIVNPGDGDVARAIRAVQRKHFDPPELDERQEPHRRMAKVR